MILTTTPTIEGKRIRAYHGIVTGEAIVSANTLKDLLGAFRNSSAAARRTTRPSFATPASWRCSA